MMKLNKLLILFTLFTMVFNNNSCMRSTDANNDEREWFESGAWRKGLMAQPDESVDIKTFYKQYHLNESLWNTAFEFFRETDLKNLKPGKYELAGDSLFVIVQEYLTKNVADTRFEAHKKYADIQYLISGTEEIGVEKLKDPLVLEPYNESSDIAFYDIKSDNYRTANQDVFFLFFPDDAHRPSLSAGNNLEVKKIVFKVLMD